MALVDVTDARAVQRAVAEFRALGRSAFLKKYGFRPARRYWLIDGSDRFDSKAIVGVAHGYQYPERGPLTHAEFSGGEETVARRLRELGFLVESADSAADPTFEIGRTYKRRKLHERFGGQYQSGIATPAGRPYLLLFTGGGEGFGYEDGWTEGVFRYFGEGQVGDMVLEGGNKALRDHGEEGKALHLFEKQPDGAVKYLGEFSCSSFEWTTAPDRNRNIRRAIVFHLVPLDAEATGEHPESLGSGPRTLAELRQLALSAASSAPERKAGEGRRTYYFRSELVRSYVLARSNGRCECCGNAAPFSRPDGSPYLEPHHTRRVSDGGPDHPRWVAAVCPNCHKRIHHGSDGAELNAQLQAQLDVLEAAP